MDAPMKANNGLMTLAQRDMLTEPVSPFKPLSQCLDAPKKSGQKRARLDSTEELPSSPFKLRKQCPDAPRISRHISFIENYEEDPEDWTEDSYILENPEERPITWAPYMRKFNKHH